MGVMNGKGHGLMQEEPLLIAADARLLVKSSKQQVSFWDIQLVVMG